MPKTSRVVVVGTTPDYIEIIRQAHPEEAVFLTDYGIRLHATEPAPRPWEEALADLSDEAGAISVLLAHLEQWEITPQGITCFDDESMALASALASQFDLPYPTLHSIAQCRDKRLCKQAWETCAVRCPRSQPIRSATELYAFMEAMPSGQCVLKPLRGSGSELVFPCASREDCDQAFQTLSQGLEQRGASRMYRTAQNQNIALAEELIVGEEYSCDFMLDGDQFQTLRLTHKIPYYDGPFGTTQAYELLAHPPLPLQAAFLHPQLKSAAQAVGLTRALCMVDFILQANELVFLEIAPRPGGDCLPWLLNEALGLDVLGLAMDFSRGRWPQVPSLIHERWTGLRLFAPSAGLLAHIDTSAIEQDPRVHSVRLIRHPQQTITLPPQDYDSWLLGHVIFRATPGDSLPSQCRELAARLDLRIEATCPANSH